MISLKKIPVELFFAVVWLISIYIVNPLGEFPLNDDWAYAKSVWQLHENGTLVVSTWPAMTLVAQIAWGALFCKFFGLSFLVLRISTLVTGWLGLIVFYRLARSFVLNRNIAIFATLLLCFNPLFFSLSFTFMTDVHFFSFLIISVYYYFKYIEQKKSLFLALAIVFSVVSALTRQPGIVLPVAYSLSVLYIRRDIIAFIKSSVPFWVTLTSLVLHSLWLHSGRQYSGNVVGIQGALKQLIHLLDAYNLLVRMTYSALYVGLFLLPLLIFYWNEIKEPIYRYKAKLLYFVVPVVILLLIGGVHYPAGNVFYNLGLGPQTLTGIYENKDSYLYRDHLDNDIWVIGLKALSITGFVMLILLALKRNQNSNIEVTNNLKQKRCFLWATITIYALLLVINGFYFDRHTIPLIGLVSLFILSTKIEYSAFQRNAAIAFLSMTALFSLYATHYYLSWNRARWTAAEYLTKELKISSHQIDGGFEFNGWYNAGFNNPPSTEEGKSWWWVTDDEYIISFVPIPGYKILKSYDFFQALASKPHSVYVLKRE